ncbi:MAG: 4Fe-4S dicluster domain-containing protein [Acidobacteria bacterium]|nr:4Fe-4S dicluster domain-containing protein [Acidobacteriota bacterium]
MGKQYGFYLLTDRCVQCHACELACGSIREVEQGLRWRKVMDVWYGEFPDITNRSFSFACAHCASPACMEVCPEEAISKRSEDGIVVVDAEKCVGCRTCGDACPFGVPQYGSSGAMQKCDMCLERMERGRNPACVETCPGEALKFGVLDDLFGESGEKSACRLAASTDPSVLISGGWTNAEVMKLFESCR